MLMLVIVIVALSAIIAAGLTTGGVMAVRSNRKEAAAAKAKAPRWNLYRASCLSLDLSAVKGDKEGGLYSISVLQDGQMGNFEGGETK